MTGTAEAPLHASIAASPLQAAVTQALGAAGPLAQALPGFVARPAQQRLAAAITQAIIQRGELLAEAGTGTGKTYAYLVPLLLSRRKAIVSTGTRALQDQLYHRDLPRVRDALGVGLTSALLKGRANYLCRYRLERARGEATLPSREDAGRLAQIHAWAGRTRMGDMAELVDLPDDSPLLPLLTSTAENCLGQECPFWSDCFVVQARQRAQVADVVVVNHHLLLADLALKQDGFGEILPGAEVFIVDEAHQLPELAAQFFGEAMTGRQLLDIAQDTVIEAKSVATAQAVVAAPVRELEHAVRLLRSAFEAAPVRGTRERALQLPRVAERFSELAGLLAALRDALSGLREASPGLEAMHARCVEALGRVERWLDVEYEAATDDVCWYELSPRGFRIQRTPLDVSGPLRQHRERSKAAWVFTSATLAVGGGFLHASKRLGLWEPDTLLEPSPFAWAERALLYLPKALPQPGERSYTAAIIEAVHPVLEASGGRAFLLFASHRALREAADLLRGGPWPLFVQGDAPKGLLLEQFRQSGNGVLLGTASFREGVDVVGEALSVVVMDKLPFAAPDDPVFEARLDAIRRAGGVPFRDEQLPQAVIATKQGVGRLLRSEGDRGVLVLCDPRLTQKSYGEVFLRSLPPARLTRDLREVQAFFGVDA